MQIINKFPPNIQDIIKVLNINDFQPVFTYGDTIYNPTSGDISEDLMVHEQVHERQQAIYGVQDWWTRYLEDKTFRTTQELEAYQAQYQFINVHYTRDIRRKCLDEFAKNLSSALYGNIIKKKEAKELICQ